MMCAVRGKARGPGGSQIGTDPLLAWDLLFQRPSESLHLGSFYLEGTRLLPQACQFCAQLGQSSRAVKEIRTFDPVDVSLHVTEVYLGVLNAANYLPELSLYNRLALTEEIRLDCHGRRPPTRRRHLGGRRQGTRRGRRRLSSGGGNDDEPDAQDKNEFFRQHVHSGIVPSSIVLSPLIFRGRPD